MGKATYGGLVPFTDWISETPSPTKIHASRESKDITRQGRIAWANIDALILECFPAAPSFPGRHPTATYLYVDDVSIAPWPRSPAASEVNCSGDIATYTYADVTISYSPLPFGGDSVAGSDRVTVRSSFSTEAMMLPANSVKWEGGDVANQEDLMAASSSR